MLYTHTVYDKVVYCMVLLVHGVPGNFEKVVEVAFNLSVASATIAISFAGFYNKKTFSEKLIIFFIKEEVRHGKLPKMLSNQ